MPDSLLRRQTSVAAASASASASVSTSASASTPAVVSISSPASVAEVARRTAKASHDYGDFERPITAPTHTWMTSPARSHPHAAHAKELPLHLIQCILAYLDNVGDLARITRTSRLFYYMALPNLYEKVILRSHAELRFIDGRVQGYGGSSPFSSGINTLVSRNFTDYVKRFTVTGEWREHDLDDYRQGRVPDNSMVLQIALRAALDKMKNLESFAWELNTKPLATVYQGLMNKTNLTSLTIRCQTNRVPRPTSTIPPMPSLITLVVYDIDPLCYPDDFSMLLLSCKKLENLKLHWSPRMREHGEESINLMSMFGRLVAAKQTLKLKRTAFYNLLTRWFDNGVDHVIDPNTTEELTFFNCMGSSDPLTVFLDDTWRIRAHQPVHPHLKMLRVDMANKEGATMLRTFKGLDRLYLISRRSKPSSRAPSSVATPVTPSSSTPGHNSSNNSVHGTSSASERESRNIGSEYLALIQFNHPTIRHLLLLDMWQLGNETLVNLCRACPNLEQIGFSSASPTFDHLREVVAAAPKVYALRLLIRPGSELAEAVDAMEDDLHALTLATESWRPEYRTLKYVGIGDNLVFKLGGVYLPPKSTSSSVDGSTDSHRSSMSAIPMRMVERVSRESVKHIEIWGMDSSDFDPSFP